MKNKTKIIIFFSFLCIMFFLSFTLKNTNHILKLNIKTICKGFLTKNYIQTKIKNSGFWPCFSFLELIPNPYSRQTPIKLNIKTNNNILNNFLLNRLNKFFLPPEHFYIPIFLLPHQILNLNLKYEELISYKLSMPVITNKTDKIKIHYKLKLDPNYNNPTRNRIPLKQKEINWDYNEDVANSVFQWKYIQYIPFNSAMG